MTRGFLAFALFTTCAPAFGQSSYAVTDLGNPYGRNTITVTGINNSGQVIGYTNNLWDASSSNVTKSFLIENGVTTAITGFGSTTQVFGLNSHGQIVGQAESAGVYHAYLYSNGVGTDLGLWGGNSSTARSINDSGVIVGYALTSGGTSSAIQYNAGVVTDLGTLGGTSARADAIDNAGTIYGVSATATGQQHFFQSSGGTLTDSSPTNFLANDVNASGVVVGRIPSSVSSMYSSAAIYTGGTVSVLPVLPANARDSSATAVNAAGTVVGYASRTGNPLERHAFRYSNGTTVDLNSLIPAESGWTLSTAGGINDFEYIVGSGINPDGQVSIFLLTPTPEPVSSLVLATAVTAGGVWWSSRSRRRLGKGRETDESRMA